MPARNQHHSLQFEQDHEKTQALLGRYVEVQQMAGGAASMYPAIAAHLAACETCRGLLEDLTLPFTSSHDNPPASQAVVLENLLSKPSPLDSTAQPSLDLVFREEIILRLNHVLSSAAQDAARDPGAADLDWPTTGYLLFYDTLRVGRLDLVVIFTLYRGVQTGIYRIEGIISPEQPALRYRALLQQDNGILDAVEGAANHLIFEAVPLSPAVSHVTVTIEGFSRWHASSKPPDQPALKSSGRRSGV